MGLDGLPPLGKATCRQDVSSGGRSSMTKSILLLIGLFFSVPLAVAEAQQAVPGNPGLIGPQRAVPGNQGLIGTPPVHRSEVDL